MTRHVAGPVTHHHEGWRVGCSCREWLSMPYRKPETPLVAFEQHVENENEKIRESRFLVAIILLVVVFGGFTLGLWL